MKMLFVFKSLLDNHHLLGLQVGERAVCGDMDKDFHEALLSCRAERFAGGYGYSGSTLPFDNMGDDQCPMKLTPAQTTWVRHNTKAYRSLLSGWTDAYATGDKVRTAERIRAMIEERNNPSPRTHTYHGRTYRVDYPNNYRAAKTCNAVFGVAMRKSIADGDPNAFDDAVENLGDAGHAVTVKRMFSKLSEVLGDHGIDTRMTNCDCGCIASIDSTTSVYCGRRSTETWCESCMEDARWCEDTEDYRHEDYAYSHGDGNYYSYEEEPEPEPSRAMSYSTNALKHVSADTSIICAPFGEFTMGIELEITSESNNVSDAIEDVRDQLGESYCIIKEDGSLPDNGFEIVTAPRGLPEHIAKFKAWNIDPAYRAWDVGQCGMHVHIDSRAFTRLTIGKFIMFINDANNRNFIRKIAGRHPALDNQAARYCRAEDQGAMDTPIKAIKGKDADRFFMVNMQNLKEEESRRLGFKDKFDSGKYNTVELRIFRASLKKDRLLAQIEFAHAGVFFCRASSYRELNGTSFLKWLKTTDNRYPHLSDWFGIRRPKQEAKEIACADAVET